VTFWDWVWAVVGVAAVACLFAVALYAQYVFTAPVRP
jgi:hypothetical protein